MSQSLSKLFIHIIFHIKSGSAEIDKTISNELYAYMGTIIKDNESIPILINGTAHDKTKHYIENQEIHHKKITFKEEYLLFLKKYGINYNEQYLWTN